MASTQALSSGLWVRSGEAEEEEEEVENAAITGVTSMMGGAMLLMCDMLVNSWEGRSRQSYYYYYYYYYRYNFIRPTFV